MSNLGSLMDLIICICPKCLTGCLQTVTFLPSSERTPGRRVRHEAGEALGAIGTPECLQVLELYQGDPCLEVAQTCQLALQRIQYYSEASTPAGSASAPAADSGLQHSSAQCMPAGAEGNSNAAAESSSPYLSVDPAPAAPANIPSTQLRASLLDEHAPIFERYRALFGLRNKVSPSAGCPYPLHWLYDCGLFLVLDCVQKCCC